jgi:hypothetical protein
MTTFSNKYNVTLLIAFLAVLIIVAIIIALIIKYRGLRYCHPASGVYEAISKKVTIVTAIYNIGRAKYDKRSMDDYKRWMLQTVAMIKDPMFIYLDETLHWKEDLLKARGEDMHHLTIIHETKLENTPMYKYKADVIRTLQNKSFQKNPNDLVNQTPYYSMLMYSKFHWLAEVAEINPFRTGAFAWFDAGGSRFFQSPQNTIRTFQFKTPLIGDTFHATSLRPEKEVEKSNTTDIGKNTPLLQGLCFLGTKTGINHVKHAIMKLWDMEMMAKNRLDTDEIALGIVYSQLKDTIILHHANGPNKGVFDEYFTEIK